MTIHLDAKWKDIDVEAFELILRKIDEDNLKQGNLRKIFDYAKKDIKIQVAADQYRTSFDIRSCQILKMKNNSL